LVEYFIDNLPINFNNRLYLKGNFLYKTIKDCYLDKYVVAKLKLNVLLSFFANSIAALSPIVV